MLNPHTKGPHVSTEGVELDKHLINVTEVTSRNRQQVLSEVIIKGKTRSGLPLEQVYVTTNERIQANQVCNLKKTEIVQKIEEKVQCLYDPPTKSAFHEKLNRAKVRLASTKKETLIVLYNEVLEAIAALELLIASSDINIDESGNLDTTNDEQ